MSENRTQALALPAKMPVSALLGLRDCADVDWDRLRALQYTRVGKKSRLRHIGNAIAGANLAWASWGAIPPLAIGAWLVLLGLLTWWSLAKDRALCYIEGRRLQRSEMAVHVRVSLVAGLVWSLPFAGALLMAEAGAVQSTWIVAGVVAVGAAVSMSSAPPSVFAFNGPICLSASAALALSGHYAEGAAALLLLAVIAYGTMTRAESFLRGALAEEGMAERNEVVSLLLREFEENEADWLWQIDMTRKVRSASPRFAFALGVEPAEAEGKPFLQLISGSAWETGQFPTSLHDLAERLKRRENFSNLLVKVTVAGGTRWWELSGTPILDIKGQHIGFRGVGSDVTEQRESTEKIAYLARYDALTELPNRLMLNEALGEAMRFAQQWRSRCAFLMIDLDRFKAVNDSLGHQIGDRLLAQVSGRLKELVSENAICGRLGGDEFAIVIRDASDLGKVDTIARKLIMRLSQPYEIDHHTLYVGASVGSAIAPRDGRTVEELMRNADLALYRAKDAGGGEHRSYEPTLHAVAEERRQLEFSLRRAIERDELLLHYQPVVNANSETIVSFEALLRWQSAELGFVSPAKFIPVAEDTRLIVPIGTWVLEQACIEATKWPSPTKVNVNVSPEQLIEPDFAATVVRALSISGLDASRLELEVTESIFLKDADIARGALEEVMALGCQIALDDFGTGYSSLGYLRTLRFSTIKVDRSFVQGAAQGNKESFAIIRAVVAMAQSMEMSTTAEGVETADEAQMIRDLGCDKIQGYYFGRPMPQAEVQSLFDRERKLIA